MLSFSNISFQAHKKLVHFMIKNKTTLLLMVSMIILTTACKLEGKTKSKEASEEVKESVEKIKQLEQDYKATNDDINAESESKDEESAEEKEIDPVEEFESGAGWKPNKKEEKEEKQEKEAKEIKEEKEPKSEKPEKGEEEEIDPVEEFESGAGWKPNKKDEKEDVKPDKPPRTDKFVGIPRHSLFDRLLKNYVSAAGVVDYAGLKKEEGKLDEYLSILEEAVPETSWNRNQKLAFWINAYNAFTLKLILKNYPVKSIMDLHDGKAWDVKWIKIGDQNLTLNDIEHKIIRPQFNDPRIHFAVNCAAKSCPPLLNAAYTDKELDNQLESQTSKFINNTKYNTIGKNTIEVSQIFNWYASDFGDIATYVKRYAKTNVKSNAEVKYIDYDWALNGK